MEDESYCLLRKTQFRARYRNHLVLFTTSLPSKSLACRLSIVGTIGESIVDKLGQLGESRHRRYDFQSDLLAGRECQMNGR